MMKFIFYALVIYFLYKIIFDLVIPATKVTRQVKTKMAEMHEEMQRQQYRNQQQQQANAAQERTNHATKEIEKDYIEFEEIK